MSAGTYDPFAIEKPVLRLGAHGEWTLGDITESRSKRLEALIGKFAELGDDASIADSARAVGELCEAACVHGDGLADLIVDLCDEDKHGDDAIGVKALTGVVEFVADWFAGESSAGNG